MANVLHISRTMGQGGAEKVVFQLVSGLLSEGIYASVASTGGELVAEFPEGIPHVTIRDIESKNLKDIWYNVSVLGSFVKKHGIDTVHCHHRMALLYAQLLRIVDSKIRVIYTAHNIFSDKLWLYRVLLSGTKIIAVGSSVKKSLIEAVGISADSIEVVDNCVLPQQGSLLFPPEIQQPYSTKVLAMARLSEQKGLGYLIEAFANKEVRERSIALYLLGDGELREELEEKAINLGIKDRVFFLGYKKNVADYIVACNFMVLPSLWEGFPLTPIEAFMNRKTLIATSISGTVDLVNNENGVLVPPRDSQALAEAIVSLSEDEALRQVKEEAAFITYQTRFSYDEFLKSYLAIYKRTEVNQ